jgi:beta-glucosidase
MEFTRRSLVLATASLAAAPALARSPGGRFPKGFLWGAATAGHQIEGNNVNSDIWLLENMKPTLYSERSGDALNSFELWPQDLDLVRKLNLNSYRFSLEWARIEPNEGNFSIAMLDHYLRMIEGCRARGLTPVVTFNHFTTPVWFARQGGWTNPNAASLFARFCERSARHLAAGIGWATTLNEPNLLKLAAMTAAPARIAQQRQMLQAAAKSLGVDKYAVANAAFAEDYDTIMRNQIAAHKSGRAAIKSVRPDLPVGVSLAIIDEGAIQGGERGRDQVRAELYDGWLAAARGDDFIGVQNYERRVWGPQGIVRAAAGGDKNMFGGEVEPASLAGAVRYAHQVSGAPVIVTEHGVATDKDPVRARLIPAALAELKRAMDEGVPVLGYLHWSLLDNFEWSIGYWPKFGLIEVDRKTFRRTPKPSARILGQIARRNAI